MIISLGLLLLSNPKQDWSQAKHRNADFTSRLSTFIFQQLVSVIRWEQWADGATRRRVSVCVEKEWLASGATVALQDTNRESPLCGPALVSLDHISLYHFNFTLHPNYTTLRPVSGWSNWHRLHRCPSVCCSFGLFSSLLHNLSKLAHLL